MINTAIEIARQFFGDKFRIEQKLYSDSSFENKEFGRFDGLYIIDYLLTTGPISDFSGQWYKLVLPEREIALANFAKVYPVSNFYALIFEYPIIVANRSFVLQRPSNFLFDTVYRVAFGYNLILPK